MLKKKIKALPIPQEEAVLAMELVKKTGLEKKLARRALEHLDAKKLRKLGLVGLCAAGGLTLLHSLSRYTFYRSAMSAELKKQLAPLRKQLDEMEQELKELRKAQRH